MSKMQASRKLRFNGKSVRVICGQIVDFWNIEQQTVQATTCTCGAQSLGCPPYNVGHAAYCDVSSDKIPTILSVTQ